MDVIAELPGFDAPNDREGGLRFLRDPETGQWTVELAPIHRAPTTAAEAREFALGCRAALAALPGEGDIQLFEEGLDVGWLFIEEGAGDTLDLHLGMNLSGVVSMWGTGYDRSRLERMIDAVLAATAPTADSARR